LLYRERKIAEIEGRIKQCKESTKIVEPGSEERVALQQQLAEELKS